MNKNGDINNRRADLISALWKGRFTILIISSLFIVFAIFFVQRSPSLWKATEEINVNQNHFLSKETQILAENIAINKKSSDEINEIISKANFTKQYIDALESVKHQKDFIETNDVNHQQMKIITAVVANSDNSKYAITIESKNKKDIDELLNKYIENSKKIANENIIIDLNNILEQTKIRENIKLNRLEKKAKIKIILEKRKIENSLKITNKVGLTSPIATASDEFPYLYLGSKILYEKLAMLKKTTDLSLIVPEIAYVKENIKTLSEIIVPQNLDFYKKTINHEVSVSTDKQKKDILIIIISTIIGLFFGFSLVLVRSEFNK